MAELALFKSTTAAAIRAATPPQLAKHFSCKRCSLHNTRRYVVLGEGSLPCDVLFVGEGPTRADNLTGRPFSGSSGRVLREAIDDALKRVDRTNGQLRLYMTYVVACRPCDSKRENNREPSAREVRTCLGRLNAVAQFASPQHVVLLGKVAHASCLDLFPGALKLYDPNYIHRQGGAGSCEYQRFVRELQDLFKGTKHRKVLRRRIRRIK